MILSYSCSTIRLSITRKIFQLVSNISSFCKTERPDEALQAVDLVHRQGFPVSRNTIHGLLRGCANTKDLAAGRRLHSLMISTGLDGIAILADHLIRLFTSSENLLEAKLAFCKVLKPSGHTWQALVSAHAILGESERALDLYKKMQQEDSKPSKFIFSCILKACRSTGTLDQGKLIHDQIIKSGLESDIVIGSALISMYSKCENLIEAQKVFDDLPNRNVVSWNAMIAGSSQCEHGVHAIELVEKMFQKAIAPNKVTFVCALKACGSAGAIIKGTFIHDLLIRIGIELDVVIGSTLVDMYCKVKCLQEAIRVFEILPTRNVVSWNALISGCIQHGQNVCAIDYFQKMQQDHIKPDKLTISSILNGCGSIEAIEQGRLMHDQLIRSGLQSDIVIGNTLVDMYGKCGSIEDARRVFSKLLHRNVVTWNAIIAGYAQHGHGHSALQLFKMMQEEGTTSNDITFSCILKACGSIGAAVQGRAIHDHIVQKGQVSNVVVQNALVDMYSKCGSLEDACEVFEDFDNRNVVSWNAIITGYMQHGYGASTFELLEEMLREGIEPDRVTFWCLLNVCANMGDIQQGQLIHCHIIRAGLQSDMALSNMVIDMYIQCGNLQKARGVFDAMKGQEGVSWSLMISGYYLHGYAFHALELFYKMQQEGFEPCKIVLSCVLQVCGSLGSIELGKHEHNEIIKRRLESNCVIGNTLVDMYAKCGRLKEARKLFDDLEPRDLVTWNVMIAGYAQHEHGLEALQLYQEMQLGGLKPNEITFSCALKACASIAAIGQGKLIHGEIYQTEVELDVVIANTLIDMYSKCGNLAEARRVFDNLEDLDVVSWNAMIAGYSQLDQGFLAMEIFENMERRGVSPDNVTFACILKACISLGSLVEGKLIHEKIIENRLDRDVTVGNVLVDMYVKCGSLEEAVDIFDGLQDRDVVSYNAMIAGYVQHDHGLPALILLRQMRFEGIKPDMVTFLSAVKACGILGGAEQGKLIHDQIIRSEFDRELAVGNTLVDMYAMCGSLEDACRIFEELPNRDVVSWCVMIAGYAQHGNCRLAGKCLNEMQEQGLKPVDRSFTSVLSACSHEVQVEEGYRHFKSMEEDYGIKPSIEHYNCMVQLLGGAGHLKEAEDLLQIMPIPANLSSWMSLLTVCRIFGNREMGNWCFDQALRLDRGATAGYVLMSNIYADLQLWEGVQMLRRLVKDVGVWKKPGKAWIEVDNHMHEFTVGDESHCKIHKIHIKFIRLRSMLKGEGYMPQLDAISEPVSDEPRFGEYSVAI